jgi:hypothetical protein
MAFRSDLRPHQVVLSHDGVMFTNAISGLHSLAVIFAMHSVIFRGPYRYRLGK